MGSPYLFTDIAWQNLAYRELRDRQARDRLVQLQATPFLAQRVAELSHYYPQLSGGVITGAALAGLDPGTPEMTRLATVEASAGAPTQPSAPNPITTHLKGLARNVFTAFDFLYKESIIGTTSFLTGLGQGLDIGEAAERSFGLSAPALAYAERLGRAGGLGGYLSEILPGGDVDQPLRVGEGILPGGEAYEGERVIREQKGVRVGQTARNPGVPVTPGRLLASTITEPGTSPFHWLSGTLDFASNVVLDPTNLLGGFVADLHKANRVLVPGGVRQTVLARNFDEWASSGQGQRIFNYLAGEQDYRNIYGLLTHSSRSKAPPDHNLVRALTEAQTAEEVATILGNSVHNYTLGNVLAPQTLTGRLLGRTSASSALVASLTGNERVAATGLGLAVKDKLSGGFMSRMAAEVGARSLNLDRPDHMIFDWHQFLKVARFDSDGISRHLRGMSEALSQPDSYTASLQVVNGAMQELATRFRAQGFEAESINQATRFFSDIIQDRQYWIDAAGNPQIHPLKPPGILSDGRMRPLPGAHLTSELLMRNIPLPDYRGLRKAMRVLDLAEKTAGRIRLDVPDIHNFRPGAMTLFGDFVMSQLWKPMVLARVAYPVRVIGEEQVRMGASGLVSAISHPIHYLGYVLGRRAAGDVLGNPMEVAQDFKSSLSRVGGGHWMTDISRHSPYADRWIVVDENHPRFLDGSGIQLEELWTDPLARELATLGGPAPLPEGPRPTWDDPDTGGVTYFHGAESDLPLSLGDISASRAKSENLIGPALYSSDDFELIQTYGRGHSLRWQGPEPPRILNMEGPLTPEAREVFRQHTINIFNTAGFDENLESITQAVDQIDRIVADIDNLDELIMGIGRIKAYLDLPGGSALSQHLDDLLRQPITSERLADELIAVRDGLLDDYDLFDTDLDVDAVAFLADLDAGVDNGVEAYRRFKELLFGRYEETVITRTTGATAAQIEEVDNYLLALNFALGEHYDAMRYIGGRRTGAWTDHGVLAWLHPENLTPRRIDTLVPGSQSNQLDDIIERLQGGDLEHVRQTWRAAGKREIADDPVALRQTVESYWARLHQMTGGEYVWRDPRDPTGRIWRDMWGDVLPDDAKAGIPEISRAREGETYLITRQGNPDLIGAVRDMRLGDLDLTDIHPSNPKAWEEFKRGLAGYRGSLPRQTKVAALADRDLTTVWERGVQRMFSALIGHPTNKLSRSVAFRQFYWKRIGQLLPSASPGVRRQILDMARQEGITRPGLRGFLANLYRPGDQETIKALHRIADDQIILADRVGAFDDPLPDEIFDMELDEFTTWWEGLVARFHQGDADAVGIATILDQKIAGDWPGDRALGELSEDAITASAVYGRLRDFDSFRRVEDMDDLAKAFALEEVRQLLYDTTRRHNFFDMARWILPFGEAWAEILTTWSKIMVENPGVLRRGQQLIEGARKSGFSYPDPDTGEEVFNYPGLGLISKFMYGAAPGPLSAPGLPPEPGRPGEPQAQFQFTGRLSGLNMALQFTPGVGPLIQIPASFFTPLNRDPDWKGLRELILPFGPTADEPSPGSILDSAFPAWVKKGFTAILGDDAPGDQARLYRNTTMNVFATMLQNGEVEVGSFEGYQAGLEVARRRAQQIFLIRSLAQFAGPTGPGVRFEVRWDSEMDPDGQVFSFQTLATAWRQMLEENAGDDAAAYDQFVEIFGLEPTAIVTPKTRQVRVRSVTEEGLGFQFENQELFRDFPLTAYFAHPDPVDGEFNYSAYLEQLRTGEREGYEPEEWLAQRNRLLGEIAYQQARKAITDEDGKVRNDELARAWLRFVREQLITRYPGFGFDVPGVVTAASAEQLRVELERWPGAAISVRQPDGTTTRLAETQAGRGIILYQQVRQAVLDAAYQRHGVSERGFASALSVQYLREWLRGVAQYIARNTGEGGSINPDFVVLWERAYEPEVDDQETADVNLLGQTFPVGP